MNQGTCTAMKAGHSKNATGRSGRLALVGFLPTCLDISMLPSLLNICGALQVVSVYSSHKTAPIPHLRTERQVDSELLVKAVCFPCSPWLCHTRDPKREQSSVKGASFHRPRPALPSWPALKQV